jgi:hypothetical protein
MKNTMMRIAATGCAGVWQSRLPERFPGNRMDRVNVLYPMMLTDTNMSDVTPLLSIEYEAVAVTDISSIEDMSEMMATVATVLLSDANDFVIVGDSTQWAALYKTPHWRLWCAPFLYESDDDAQFKADLTALGLSSDTTRTQARELIKTMLTGG